MLYSLNRDGVSIGTFYEKARFFKQTLMIIKEKAGYIFGAYCTETWKSATKFYGTGENFLFTFRDGDKIEVFNWTGEDD